MNESFLVMSAMPVSSPYTSEGDKPGAHSLITRECDHARPHASCYPKDALLFQQPEVFEGPVDEEGLPRHTRFRYGPKIA